MAAKIIAVEDVGNGTHVDVTLDAAPVGVMTWKKSRLPGDPAAAATTAADQGGNVWRVRVRNNPVKVRMHYFVQAFDGATALTSYQLDRTQAPAEETCCWVCLDDNRDWLWQTERALLDILLDNLQALNHGMELYLGAAELPSGAPNRLQRVHSGIPAHSDGAKYPQLSLRTYSLQDDPYFANPRSDYLPITTQIAVYLCHGGQVNWEPLVRALGMAVWNVLNQTHYVEVELDCGLWLSECYALTGGSTEEWDEAAGVWVAAFTINWQAKLFVGMETLDDTL